jgi:hypothetical protein
MHVHMMDNKKERQTWTYSFITFKNSDKQISPCPCDGKGFKTVDKT